VNIFQNPKWKQEYAIEINNRFEILENMDDEDNIDISINPLNAELNPICHLLAL
jgi:hypothetical protein